MSKNTNHLPLTSRHFGRYNTLGVWTLYKKEVHRFLKVGMQTVAAPVISSVLFLIIFKLALGRVRPDVNGIPFADFLAPGLVMMAILTNAFANSSSSLLTAKLQGNLVDILMPPLSPGELTFGLVMGGASRGVLVAIVTTIAMIPLANFNVVHWWAFLYFAISASLLMSQVGVLVGIWAERFDHMSAITNFLITPLIFLSGTFYSVKMLPHSFYVFSQANPIFYLIDGFRYGAIGQADGSVLTGVLVIAVLNILLAWACLSLLRSGYRLKG